MTVAHVELSMRALKDLRGLDASTRLRVETFIEQRVPIVPSPANVDIRPLEDKVPWLRARVGDVRILCRRLTRAELKTRGIGSEQGYLILRLIQRRDLDRAVRQL